MFMLIALTIAHIFVSLILVFMVLIQDSKGDASGLLGSSGGQSVFGATGASSFIVKATRVVAVLFAAGCIGLAYLSSDQANSSGVFDRVNVPVTQPVEGLDTTAPVIPVEGTALDATTPSEKAAESTTTAPSEKAAEKSTDKSTETPAKTK